MTNFCLKKLKKKIHKCKIIKVETKLNNKIVNSFKNEYFLSKSNKDNLAFVIEIAKKFKVSYNSLLKAIKNFKGLKYRQQVIFDNKNISVINDSKSTSYASSIELLKKLENIYWLLGGIPKKGDKFTLSKKYCQNIKGFIFGKKYKKFSTDLKNKIELRKFSNLKQALIGILSDIQQDNSIKKTILLSPAAASFDTFKDFEDRGYYFNKLIKKYLNVK